MVVCLKITAALGAGTILGGAAFNVFPILGTIVLVPLRYRSVRKIEKYGVFWVEMIWSIWAFLWVLIILQVEEIRRK